MKKTNLFCLVAKTGAGKSKYLNQLTKNTDFLNKNNLSLLVTGTTRSKRENEVDGVDYHYCTREEYENTPEKDLVEFRSYYTLNNGEVFYFTKTDYIKSDKNIICIASPYQYESYRNWCNLEKLKNNINIDIYMILISSDIKVRIERLMERAKNDDDVYEMCRRIVQERHEFEDVSKRLPELIDPMLANNVCYINNTCNGEIVIKNNLEKIKNYIHGCIERSI